MDVDSTIWDTGAWVCSAVLEVTGEALDMEGITTWTHVLDTYGEETTTAIFDRVFDPERIRDREPYPGAPEVLRALQERLGIEIHFVTHNDPGDHGPSSRTLARGRISAPEVGLTVTTEDKLGILDALGAFGLIDDRPDTIERVADAGLWAAAMNTAVEPRPPRPQERHTRLRPLARSPQSPTDQVPDRQRLNVRFPYLIADSIRASVLPAAPSPVIPAKAGIHCTKRSTPPTPTNQLKPVA